MPQENQPNVTASPNMYIDVIINNQKQIYDIQTAKYLRDQLDHAITAIEVAPTAVDETGIHDL